REGYRHTVEHSLYVDAAMRGREIGSALLAAVINHAVSAGVHVIVAGIAGDNAASIHLHERLGFATTGHLREVGHQFDRWLATVPAANVSEMGGPGPCNNRAPFGRSNHH